VKQSLCVLSNVSNSAPFGGHVEPSHSNCGASTWTCVKPSGDGNTDNGTSVDQVIANQVGTSTPLPSVQVGLSTLDSSTDGLPGQHSRSMAWKSMTEPLYKTVNPQAVFDRLVAGAPAPNGAAPDPAAERRRASRKSALDYVIESASAIQKQVSTSDRKRLDQFLTSTRDLEKRVSAPAMQIAPASCMTIPRPTDVYNVGNVPQGYSREAHAQLMMDLVTMAIRCDITRVVSFMLDDARSDFVYDFLVERAFTDTGSTPKQGSKVAGYHGLQHAGDRNDGFATIGWWNAQKASELAQRLAGIDEGDAGNALDNTVITFASGMHGGNHDAQNLPIALIGGGGRSGQGAALKTNQHFAFANETRLADVHLTILQQVFGCPDQSFGASSGIIADLLA
jgi:hypothetical protein